MGSKGKHVDIPLATLIALLEREGFRIGIGLRLKLQQVLYSFWDGLQPADLERMKDYIRPLVAKSEKEEGLFDHAYELFVKEIQRESDAFKKRIISGEKPPEPPRPPGEKPIPKKNYTKLFLLLLDVVFVVLFSYSLHFYRQPPKIHLTKPITEWVSLNEKHSIEGHISGVFTEGKILIDGKEVTQPQRHWFPKEQSIRFSQSFNIAKTYEIGFRARNVWAFRDTLQTYTIVVCKDRPIIDFTYEVDAANPRKISFAPVLDSVDITRPYRISLKANDSLIPSEKLEVHTDNLLVYEFPYPDPYEVEMTVAYEGEFESTLCHTDTKHKTISIDDGLILGDKKELALANPREGIHDTKTLVYDLDSESIAFDLFGKDSWNSLTGKELILLIGVLLLLFVLLPLCLELFYFRKRKTALSYKVKRGLEFEGIQPPYELEFPIQDHHIRPEKELFELSRLLKTRQEAGTVSLDVDESIRKTAEKAGFMDLQFKETTKIPEYLVVVDRNHSGGFHLELFDYVSGFLKNEDTLMEVFYFNDSLRHLKNPEHPHGISIETLSEKYPDHILLVVSDGKNMVSPKWDRVFDWAQEIIPKWDKKFLLTPRSYSEWDSNENLLDPHIPVLPATLNGLQYLSENLLNEELPDLKQRVVDLKLEQRPSFYSYTTVEAIEEFLKEPILFQWFCSLAVYPKIHWPLVVVIGKALSEQYSDEGVAFPLNYQSLYKISEVSHLLEGKMDDDLRMDLLDRLEPKAERIARKAVLDLLHQTDVPEDSFMYREILVQTTLNQSLLNKNDGVAARDLYYLWEHNLIEDWVSKNYMEGSENLWEEEAKQFFEPINPKSWKHLLFPRGPMYLISAFLLVLMLNFSVFPMLFDKPATGRLIDINYSAELNNHAVRAYEMGDELKAADSLQKGSDREYVVWQVPYNLDVIEFNRVMDAYKTKDFEGVLGHLSQRQFSDSLLLDVFHYQGLSHYYLGDSENARRYLDTINYKQPEYFDQFLESLETLLEGTESSQADENTNQNEVTDPDPDPEGPNLCGTYSGFSRELWRKEFLKPLQSDSWQVVVASFNELDESDLDRATRTRNIFLDKHPNLDFDIMPSASNLGPNAIQYSVVLAKGLGSQSRAREIAAFAQECGIAPDAFVIQGYVSPPCKVELRVHVQDSVRLNALYDAEVVLLNAQRQVIQKDFVDRGGSIVFNGLECGQRLWVRASLAGYETKEEYITLVADSPEPKTSVYLNLVKETTSPFPNIAFQPIYFDYDKYNIRPDAAVELAKVVAAMREYPELQIRIESHTDSRGNSAYNITYTEKMAQSVMDYLISKGIDRQRLSAIGFGEEYLVNKCANGVECNEEQHQQNRRTEFKIVQN